MCEGANPTHVLMHDGNVHVSWKHRSRARPPAESELRQPGRVEDVEENQNSSDGETDGHRTKDGRLFESRAVVLANGAFQTPQIPALSHDLSPEVLQFSAESSRQPAQVPQGTVLVVGDGASGRQNALELSATHRAFLSAGRPRRVGPEQILERAPFGGWTRPACSRRLASPPLADI